MPAAAERVSTPSFTQTRSRLSRALLSFHVARLLAQNYSIPTYAMHRASSKRG